MFKLWSDLFKAANVPSASISTEIHEDWLAIEEDHETAETVQNIHNHQILTAAMKQRRVQWQKRIQKGRSSGDAAIPAKALRRRSRNSTSSRSEPTRQDGRTVLQKKLQVAIEASKGAVEVAPAVAPKTPKQRVRSVRNTPYQVKSCKVRAIQQPAGRSMN